MTNSNIYTNIRLRRKNTGISQKTLAVMTGLDFSAISLIERGKRIPRSYNLSRINEALLYAQAFFDKYGVPYGKECPGDVKNNAGERIRYLRLKACLTQRQLADLSGIREAAIYRVERNKVNPSLETIIKIANALKCLANDLIIENTSKAGIDWDNLANKD